MENINGLIIENGEILRCISEEPHITIPDGITGIKDGAFRSCSSLISVTIPLSVTSIGKWAFFCCENLENVKLSRHVAVMGHDAFGKCPKLFDENGFLIVGDFLLGYQSTAKEAIIPDSVNTIMRNAFFCNKYLESVTIPDGVVEINDGAFSSCHALKHVTIPDSVQFFGKDVFSDCNRLSEITCPERIKKIIDDSTAGYIMKLIKNTAGG